MEGIEEWLVIVALMATGLAGLSVLLMAYPSADVMRDIANVGIVLVLAYIVEAAWLTPHMIEHDEDKDILGALLGIGIAGFLGVIVAILISAHRAAGHGNLLDDFGLGWSVTSLAALGAIVVLQPLLAYVVERRRKRRS